jgi:hypothetical protein
MQLDDQRLRFASAGIREDRFPVIAYPNMVLYFFS